MEHLSTYMLEITGVVVKKKQPFRPYQATFRFQVQSEHEKIHVPDIPYLNHYYLSTHFNMHLFPS